jgi:hypothetical protein
LLYKPKNRTFNYNPRFSNENHADTNDDSSSKKDFIPKRKGIHKQNRKVKTTQSISTLILLLVLLLIGMFVLNSYIE